jgi:hypothetical protein
MVTRRKYLDDEDIDDMVPEGASIRVPLYLCDSLQKAVVAKYGHGGDDLFDEHRPRFLTPSPELLEFRARNRTRYVQDLNSAWKSPAQRAQLARGTPGAFDAGVRDAARDAYFQMVKRGESAWRTPHKDAAQPDTGSTPQEWQRHLAGPRPGTNGEKLDPNAASRVQAQQESWQGRDLAELARDVEARRRAAHAEFSQRLSNAWRRDV